MAERERREALHRWQQSRAGIAVDLESVVPHTEGFTGAQMQELCRLAVLEALDEHLQAGRDGNCPVAVERSHIECALARCNGRPRREIGFTSSTLVP